MNELALYAGGGGDLLASQCLLGHRTVCYVEIDRYCQEIIKARIRDGLLDDAPIWDDARTFEGRPWRGVVDIVSGGFPCQPFSVAGQRRGEDDPRNLWPDTLRIIGEVRPRYAFLENVPGLLTSGYFGRILGDLAEIGYDARWAVISAASQGDPHRRDRLWVVAYPESWGRAAWPGEGKSRGCGEAPDHDQQGQPQFQGVTADAESSRGNESHSDGWWATEPPVGRVADGVASRVDRLKALGNGQVPIVAATAWELLKGW